MMQIPEKARQDTLRQKCVLQPVGYAGHVLHSGVSGVRNINALMFRLGWGWRGFQKKRVGTRSTELVFFAFGGIWGPRSAF
jgi:hypothetical protein